MADSSNKSLRIKDIGYGSTFDYDLTHWKVTGEYLYQWDDGDSTREFKIIGRGKNHFLEYEEGKEQTLQISKKIRINSIQEDVAGLIHRNSKPPTNITYQNSSYTLEGEFTGKYKEIGSNSDWESLTCWDYVDSTGQNFISIEEWGPREFETYAGKTVVSQELSNITKGSNPLTSWAVPNMGWIAILGFFFMHFFICSDSNGCASQDDYSYTTNNTSTTDYSGIEGLSKTIEAYATTPDFTITLEDMTYNDGKYQHKYQVLIPRIDSTFDQTTTEWETVSRHFFIKHKDHLGMELAYKKDDALHIGTTPAGFGQYVGDPTYGEWKEEGGNSYWAFYGRYRLLNTLLNAGHRRVYHSSWNDYRNNYRGTTATYYGPNNSYGTSNYLSSEKGKKSTWGFYSPDYRQRILTKQEEESSSSGGSSRTRRNSSRYSNSGSSRSRSGGFGK